MSYSKNFLFALKEVLGIEAGFVDDKNDNGGATNFGIAEATAREAGYQGDMKDLKKEDAISIYFKLFWKNHNLDLIENANIAKEVFEFGVNSGMVLGIKTLQRAYNALNENVIGEDGILGKHTAQAVNNYEHPESLYKVQNVFQGNFYLALAEGDKEAVEKIKHHTATSGNPKNKHFIRGWIEKRVKL